MSHRNLVVLIVPAKRQGGIQSQELSRFELEQVRVAEGGPGLAEQTRIQPRVA